MIGLTQAYDFYTENGGTLPYKKWRWLCEEFNKRAVEHLLEGRRLDMKHGLSFLQIVRSKNKFKNPVVNWKASHERKAELLAQGKKLYDKETGEGEQWLVYFTNDFYYWYFWKKKYARCRNVKVYQFVPSRGKVGAKTKLSSLLKSDELAHMRYADAKQI